MVSQDNPPSEPRRARGRPRDWSDKTAQNTIKSLDRAMEVFEFLSEHQGKALTTLASETDQSPATVYRILVTLEGRGLVERARPVMRRLMEQTGETANLGIERGGQVLFVSQVETEATIRAFFPPGTLSPMHASGIGKALLAEMDDARLQRALSGKTLTAFTPHSITDLNALRADLEQVRARGYAVDAEERNIGMRCIAAPVFDIHQEAVAGISVSGPTSRVGLGDIERLSVAVRRAAADLSATLGG